MYQRLLQDLPAEAKRLQVLSAGQRLFHQTEKTRGIFAVVKGQVQLCRTTEAGETLILHCAMPGQLFAEASLFADHYHCDAVAVTEAEVLRLGKTAVLKALAEDQAFSLAFHQLLAKQVQHYRQRVALLAIRSAEERVYAAVQMGLLNTTVTELAEQIGLSREACYRALRQLVTQGRLKKLGRGRYL